MKKLLTILLVFSLLLGLIPGCSANPPDQTGKLQIVCTMFPEYDWVRQILGAHAEQVELTLLLEDGVDFHSYQPTANDIIRISSCDLFVYVGGESDAWVEDALSEAQNQSRQTVRLLDVIGARARTEEHREGMQADGHEEDDPSALDEHVWLSLKNASAICAALADALASVDASHAADYQANAADYCRKLDALDSAYAETVQHAAFDTLLFGGRFPFRYLIEDYGLQYYAAFPGCSTETEASFETIVFLAEKLDELALPCLLITDQSEETLAETIRNNTKEKNQSVFLLDSMQSIPHEDIQSGATYLSIMQGNLDVLKSALNG